MPDQLREALRARESLAPDPEAVLVSAHGRIKRRRARRRVAGAAAAVAVVMAGTGAGMSLLRPSDEPGRVEPAAGGDDGAPVAAPALPFTVGGLPADYTLTGWTISDGDSSALYQGKWGDQVQVVVSGAAAVPSFGDGAPGYTPADALRVQEVVGGRLVTVFAGAGRFGSGDLLRVARSVRFQPTPVPSTLRALRAPRGLDVRQWSGSPGFDDLLLCPPAVPATTPVTADDQCYSVTVDVVKALRTQQPPPGRPGEATTVRRVLDDRTVLSVSTVAGDRDAAEAIAASAVPD